MYGTTSEILAIFQWLIISLSLSKIPTKLEVARKPWNKIYVYERYFM